MKKHLSLALGAAILLSGCAAMQKLNDAMQKANAESQHKARLEQNAVGFEVPNGDLTRVASAAEQAFRELGYTVQDQRFNQRGPRPGMSVVGRKETHKDLGAQIGMNVLGNMLGADRGKIVKQHNEMVFANIWYKWNDATDNAAPGVLLMEISGEERDINQNNEASNITYMTVGTRSDLQGKVLAKLK